jgi:hypothetical protein
VGLADSRPGRPPVQLSEPPAAHVIGIIGDHPQRPDRVATAGVGGVRQPLHPFPLRGRPRPSDNGEPGVGRAVPEDVLRDHGPGQRPRRSEIGIDRLDPHRGTGAQRQRDRQLRHDGVGQQEPAQGQCRDRLDALHRPGLRGDEPGGQALITEADADVPEVRIGRAALPQPAVGQHSGPGSRIGMGGLGRGPLLRGDAQHPVTLLGQVTQVVAAVLVDAGAARAPSPARAAGHHHAQCRDREHASEKP